MSAPPLLDAAGRRRSPATLPGHHRGRPPRNKGLRSPDPPTVEELARRWEVRAPLDPNRRLVGPRRLRGGRFDRWHPNERW